MEVFDGVCRALTAKSGIIVVSVEYKLAPEHKFPEGLEDAYAAVKWVAQNAASFGADSEQLAVGGDSAGGNFAAAVSVLARYGRQQTAIHCAALLCIGIALIRHNFLSCCWRFLTLK